jgi:hypothetical protein
MSKPTNSVEDECNASQYININAPQSQSMSDANLTYQAVVAKKSKGNVQGRI